MEGLDPLIQRKPVEDDVTVIIPTLGRAVLEACLRCLAGGATWPAMVIVIDQGRNPKAAGWMESLRQAGIDAIYIPSNRHGRSAGINRGFERVRTRFVAITDDDCFVTAGWLPTMMARLRKEPGAVVTGRVEQAGDQEVAFSVVNSREAMRYERPQLRVHPLIGANVGMSMETVRRIGPFDEHSSVGSAEDSDYGYRALRLGIPILYDPDVALIHYHWRDANQRAIRYAEYARSQGGFYGKFLLHGGWLIPLQAGRDLVRGPVRWIRGAIRKDQDMIDRGRADTLHLLPGIAAGVRRSWRR